MEIMRATDIEVIRLIEIEVMRVNRPIFTKLKYTRESQRYVGTYSNFKTWSIV